MEEHRLLLANVRHGILSSAVSHENQVLEEVQRENGLEGVLMGGDDLLPLDIEDVHLASHVPEGHQVLVGFRDLYRGETHEALRSVQHEVLVGHGIEPEQHSVHHHVQNQIVSQELHLRVLFEVDLGGVEALEHVCAQVALLDSTLRLWDRPLRSLLFLFLREN